MADVTDFFFSDHETPLVRRWRAALADGLAHGSHIAPADPAPGEPVALFFASDARLPLDRVAVYYTADGGEPRGERGTVRAGEIAVAEMLGVERDALTGMLVRRWRATIPGQPEGVLVRYRADGWSVGVTGGASDGQAERSHWRADDADPLSAPAPDGRLFAYSVDRFGAPDWFEEAVFYHIVVDRFSAAHDEPPLRDTGVITDIFGGTLRGVAEKLEYIEALGATCIWLSPVFESPSHHGYDATSFHMVAKRLGGDDALRELVRAAHARGIRVVLDFVPNHTSDQHPAFAKARANPGGPLTEWFSFGDWPPNGYRAYANVPSMPQLATDHPEVRRYLIEAALYWLEAYGVDGFRLDHVPGPSHAFWATFQHEIKRRFPEALTVGEITETPENIGTYAGRMDASMDFPLAYLMRTVFGRRAAPLSELARYLRERATGRPVGMRRATLLDNHDMHRFLWLAHGEKARLRLAVACLFTLDGTPIIYYGTEVGLSQYGDAHRENAYARAPMFWGADQDVLLLAYYQRLITLRRSHPALRRGSLTLLPVELVGGDSDGHAAEQVVAYARALPEEQLVVALNNNRAPLTLRIALEGIGERAGREVAEARELLEAGGEARLRGGGALEVALPALGAAIVALG